MPYVKISAPPSYANGNKGSAKDLAEYLEKENIGKDLADREYFFSHTQDHFTAQEVTSLIDNNKKGLKNNETKFYEFSLSFSQKEIEFLKSRCQSPEGEKGQIKGYIRDVMDEYARNFSREGKKLTGYDLVYFAKIEENRKYSPKDPNHEASYKHNYKVRQEAAELRLSGASPEAIEKAESQYIRNTEGTIILPGNQKDGDNTHVHVIVSRRDASQKMSLSPLANSRGSKNMLNGKKVDIGFDRDAFAQRVETRFDERFGFSRERGQSYHERKAEKEKTINPSKLLNMAMNSDRLDGILEAQAKMIVRKAIKQNLQKFLILHNKQHLLQGMNIALSANKSAVIQLATKEIKNELAKSVAQKGLAKGLMAGPVPYAAVIKAVSVAVSLVKAQDKGKHLEQDGISL